MSASSEAQKIRDEYEAKVKPLKAELNIKMSALQPGHIPITGWIDGAGIVSVNAEYAAGIVDGEGCLGISMAKQTSIKRGLRLDAEISVRNTNRQALGLVNSFMFSEGIFASVVLHSKQTKTCKTSYSLRISNLKAIQRFCVVFDGKLVIKAEQLRLMKLFVQSRLTRLADLCPGKGELYGYTPNEVEIAEKLRTLNKRGP